MSTVNITDPKVQEALDNCKTIKYTQTSKPEIIDTTPCEHHKTKSTCLKCLYAESQEPTRYQIGRSYYIKFSRISLTEFKFEDLPKDLIEKRTKELELRGKHLIQKSLCGFVDVFIRYLEYTAKYVLDENEAQILKYLANIVYNQGKTIELTKDQEYELNSNRRHIFDYQVSNIMDRIDSNLKYEIARRK